MFTLDRRDVIFSGMRWKTYVHHWYQYGQSAKINWKILAYRISYYCFKCSIEHIDFGIYLVKYFYVFHMVNLMKWQVWRGICPQFCGHRGQQ